MPSTRALGAYRCPASVLTIRPWKMSCCSSASTVSTVPTRSPDRSQTGVPSASTRYDTGAPRSGGAGMLLSVIPARYPRRPLGTRDSLPARKHGDLTVEAVDLPYRRLEVVQAERFRHVRVRPVLIARHDVRRGSRRGEDDHRDGLERVVGLD